MCIFKTYYRDRGNKLQNKLKSSLKIKEKLNGSWDHTRQYSNCNIPFSFSLTSKVYGGFFPNKCICKVIFILLFHLVFRLPA